jgi:hypothetical protein
MRACHGLFTLAILVALPARADDGPAAKPPAQAEAKDAKSHDASSCCADDANDKVKCPRMKAAAKAGEKSGEKARAKAATAAKKPAAQAPDAPAAKAVKPEPVGAANMVVVRDPETGEIRNATAAERERLLGRRPQAAAAAPRVVVLPDGTEMVELGEDSMSYAVARRNPDGTLTQTCVEGPEAAAAARKPKAADAPAPRPDVR